MPGKRTRVEAMVVQRKPAGNGEDRLPEPVRGKMEHAFGEDFSEVRVHTDSRAADEAGAAALAHGQALHFGPGRYDPSSTLGQELIGHELAHVVQQRRGETGATQAKGDGGSSDPLEQEADVAGARAARGERVAVTGRAAPAAQHKEYKPGDRIRFTHDGKEYSGVVVRLKEKAFLDKNKVYEVEANMDGTNRSVLVKNKRLIEFEEPEMPDVSEDVELLRKQCRELTQEDLDKIAEKFDYPTGAAVGDLFLEGMGIVINRPSLDGVPKNDPRHDFIEGVLRDLAIIARSKSGKGLLASIREAAEGAGTFVVIAYVDGRLLRANAGQVGGGGKWNTKKQEPSTSSRATVTYNPSHPGLPLSQGPDDKSYPMKVGTIDTDEEIFGALSDGWGRAKNKPTDVSLFHELVHGDDYLHGRLDDREAPRGQSEKTVKISERHAVGLDEYRDDDFLDDRSDEVTIYSENTYRKERGVALRDWYDNVGELVPAEDPVDDPLSESRVALRDEVIRSNKRAYQSREEKPRAPKSKKKKKVREKKRKEEKEQLSGEKTRGHTTTDDTETEKKRDRENEKETKKPTTSMREGRVCTYESIVGSRGGAYYIRLQREIDVHDEKLQTVLRSYYERAVGRTFEGKSIIKLEFNQQDLADALFDALESV